MINQRTYRVQVHRCCDGLRLEVVLCVPDVMTPHQTITLDYVDFLR